MRGRTVYIGGVRHRLFCVPKVSGPTRKGMRIMGQHRPITSEIYYRKGLRNERTVTIAHEILHAIDHQFDIGLLEITVDLIARELVGALAQLRIIK